LLITAEVGGDDRAAAWPASAGRLLISVNRAAGCVPELMRLIAAGIHLLGYFSTTMLA
jgi:hypothetical protein